MPPVKNTVYIFAKTSPYVLTPELFALHLGLHFTKRYDHIAKAHIKVTSLKWTRIDVRARNALSCARLPPLALTTVNLSLLQVDGIGAHPHSFLRDGEEKRIASATVSKGVDGGAPTAEVSSGVKDLVVLKSAGSAFNGFWRDENTTLPGASSGRPRAPSARTALTRAARRS